MCGQDNPHFTGKPDTRPAYPDGQTIPAQPPSKHDRFKKVAWQSELLRGLANSLDAIEKKSPNDYELVMDIMMISMSSGKMPAGEFRLVNELYNRWCT